MSVFSDFFRMVASVFLGGAHGGQEFLEPLNMADRYLRWGHERGDIRDFQSCLSQLDLAKDEESPKPDFVARKYKIYCNATMGIIELLRKKYEEQIGSAKKQHDERSKEKSMVEKELADAKKRKEQLTKDGSLIKAKEEERHIDSLQTRLGATNRSLAADEAGGELATAYQQLTGEVEQLLGRLDSQLISVENNTEMPADVAGALRNEIQENIQRVRSEIESINPVPSA